MAYSQYDQGQIVAQIQAFFQLKRATDESFLGDVKLSGIDGGRGGKNSNTNNSIRAYLEQRGLSDQISFDDPDFLEKIYNLTRVDLAEDSKITQHLENMSDAMLSGAEEIAEQQRQIGEAELQLAEMERVFIEDDTPELTEAEQAVINESRTKIEERRTLLQQKQQLREQMLANPEMRKMLRAGNAFNGHGGMIIINDEAAEQAATIAAAKSTQDHVSTFSVSHMSPGDELSDMQSEAANYAYSFLKENGLVSQSLMENIGNTVNSVTDFVLIQETVERHTDTIRDKAAEIANDPAAASTQDIFMMQSVLGLYNPEFGGTVDGSLGPLEMADGDNVWGSQTMQNIKQFITYAAEASNQPQAEPEPEPEPEPFVYEPGPPVLDFGEEFHTNNPFRMTAPLAELESADQITKQAVSMGNAIAFHNTDGKVTLERAALSYHSLHDEDFARELTEDEKIQLGTIAEELGVEPGHEFAANDPRLLQAMSAYANGIKISALPDEWVQAFAEVSPHIIIPDNKAVETGLSEEFSGGAADDAPADETASPAEETAIPTVPDEQDTAVAEEAPPPPTAEILDSAPEPQLTKNFRMDAMMVFTSVNEAFVYEFTGYKSSYSIEDSQFTRDAYSKYDTAMDAYNSGDPVQAFQAAHELASFIHDGLASREMAFVQKNWNVLHPYFERIGETVGSQDYEKGLEVLRNKHREIVDATYDHRGAYVRELLRDRNSFNNLEKPRAVFEERIKEMKELAAKNGITLEGAKPEAAVEPAPETAEESPETPKPELSIQDYGPSA